MVRPHECVRCAVKMAKAANSTEDAHRKGTALGRSISAKLRRTDELKDGERTFQSEVEMALLAISIGRDTHLNEVAFGALEGLKGTEFSLP